MADIQLTPTNIPTTDFSQKVDEYASILSRKTDKEIEIAETELDIRELFASYEIGVRIKGDNDLLGLEDKLTIYKPVEEKKEDGLVYVAARAEGRAFSEIVANPPLMKRLEKKFGGEFREFFRAVDDVFHMTGEENTKRQELDTEKTDKLKTEYFALAKKLMRLKIELQKIEKELDNVDKYVSFTKTIAALAPQGGKQKGGGQQGGGQSQQKGGDGDN